jgi:hypothetical protein
MHREEVLQNGFHKKQKQKQKQKNHDFLQVICCTFSPKIVLTQRHPPALFPGMALFPEDIG